MSGVWRAGMIVAVEKTYLEDALPPVDAQRGSNRGEAFIVGDGDHKKREVGSVTRATTAAARV